MGIADQSASSACSDPPADDGERDLSGEEFVIGEASAHFWRRDFRRWGLDGFDRFEEGRPLLAFQQRAVVPFGERWEKGDGLGDAGCQLPRPETGGERPD